MGNLPTVNFIGCGRVGRTLAKLWHHHHLLTIQQVMTRSQDSAAAAVEHIGVGEAISDIGLLKPADWLMIATADDAIPEVVGLLYQAGIVQPGTRVLHFSGCLSNEILAVLKGQGAQIGSVHPLLSFAQPDLAYDHFAGTFCIMDGDPECIAAATELFTAIEGQAIEIEPSDKSLYHAATSFPGNFIYALADIGAQLFHQVGFEQQQASQISASLLMGAAKNIASRPGEPLLSGPIGRGDIGTIRKHIVALKDSRWLDSYRVLAREVLRVAPLSDAQKVEFEELLS